MRTKPEEKTLPELAKSYVANKAEQDKYKKLCETENAILKERMEDEGVDAIPVSDKKELKRIISTKYEVDEAKMLNVLKQYGVPATKTVEVIDEEALENYLYNLEPGENFELIEALNRCKTKKHVVSLKLVNAKKVED